MCIYFFNIVLTICQVFMHVFKHFFFIFINQSLGGKKKPSLFISCLIRQYEVGTVSKGRTCPITLSLLCGALPDKHSGVHETDITENTPAHATGGGRQKEKKKKKENKKKEKKKKALPE